jgi:simple sugar transport system ATP-binding protein
VKAVADRIEVLRLGRRVARFTGADVSMEELVGAMTGALEQELEKPSGTGSAEGEKR